MIDGASATRGRCEREHEHLVPEDGERQHEACANAERRGDEEGDQRLEHSDANVGMRSPLAISSQSSLLTSTGLESTRTKSIRPKLTAPCQTGGVPEITATRASNTH